MGVRNVNCADRAGLNGALPALGRSRLRGVKVRSLLRVVQRVGQRLRDIVRLWKRAGRRGRSRRHRVLTMRGRRGDRGVTRRGLRRRRTLRLMRRSVQRLGRRGKRRQTMLARLLLLRLHMWRLRVVLLLLLLNERLVAGVVPSVRVFGRRRRKGRRLGG